MVGFKKFLQLSLMQLGSSCSPKKYGGWGIRNIYYFSRALAAKSLWRGLLSQGIWQRVLKDKYYPHLLVSSWLHSAEPLALNGSQTWKNLINALPLLVHWLAWKPGSGFSIITGKDMILGMDRGSFLSAELIKHLNDHHVYYLFQARSATTVGTCYTKWLSCVELGLEGVMADEWETYRKRLIDVGIALTEASDELKWTGGDCTGILTTKNVYNALATKLWHKNIGGW
jgi:hypothetical protein